MNFDVASALGYDCSPGLTPRQDTHIRAINRPCICQPLHLRCDPSRCPVAARAPIPPPVRTRSENGYNPISPSVGVMHARYARLQKSAGDGCPTCAVIIDGLLTYGIYEKLNARFDTAIQVDRTGLVTVDEPGTRVEGDEGAAVGFITLEIIPDLSQESNPACQAFALAIPPVETTASNRSVQDLKSWISQCSFEHESCSNVAISNLPTRVLDVENESISLHETQREEKALYLTLSYCWGFTGAFLKTTAANLETFKAGIPWDLLPKTFQDAVTIARELQVRYLWIDSLCIVQDDVEDCNKEMQMMGDIYQKSYLTIAASQAKDPSCGCFTRPQKNSHSKLKSIIARKSSNQPIYEPADPDAKHSGYSVRFTLNHDKFRDRPSKYFEIEMRNIEPLNRRGWTFQERLLSKRVVHYTSQEMVWECGETMRCQCNRIQYVDQSLKFSISDALRTEKALLALWVRIIEEYTERDMTYESDRLPALAGVARQFMDAGMGDYLAGLFRKHVIQLTTWRKRIVSGVIRSEIDGTSSVYLGPSWSWVSANSPVQFLTDVEFSSTSRRCAAVEINSMHWQSLTPDLTHSVCRAHLVVTGCIFPALIYYGRPPGGKAGDYEFLVILRHGPHSTPNQYINGVGVYDDSEMEEKLKATSAAVYCMLWSIPRGQTNGHNSTEDAENFAYYMLLEKSDSYDVQNQPDSTYRRLGIGYLPWISASELFEKAEEQTITIV